MPEDNLDCDRIWRDYKDKIFSYIKSHVSNADDAEDLLSSVFEKIVGKSKSYRGNPNAVSSFVYAITRNSVIDYYRVRRPSQEIPDTLKSESSAEDGVLAEDALGRLAAALESLSQLERDIVVLHYYNAVPLKEIAAKMNESYGKIKLAHAKALERLQKML